MSDLLAAVNALRDAGIDNPRLDARLLWAHAGGDPARFDALLVRRRAREPLAYIVGRKEFWSLEFSVGPGVLIPRPDSETVVEAVLAAFPDRRLALDIADLGTGTGCLIAALLAEYPVARGVAADSSPAAARYAAENLKRFGLQTRCWIDISDWGAIAGHFDVVVSNPPYIKTGDIPNLEPEVALFEPHAALDGGADGLDSYRELALLIKRLLNPGGRTFAEIGVGQEKSVKKILQTAGFIDVTTKADLAGIPRVVCAQKP